MSDLNCIPHAKAIALGKLAVRATTAAGSGHPTSALSLAHIVTVLMYRVMRWDPKQPGHRGADRLVLSEGHAVPIVYAACADLGVMFLPHGHERPMTIDDLMTLRDIGSAIDGHPNPALGFPFFDAATGSLGQGLSVAGGLGCAARLDGIGKRIYCIIGDGESREGQIWEAMDFIADQRLDNVVAIFNCNTLGQSDFVSPEQDWRHLERKAAAFGWAVEAIDGHDPAAIERVVTQVRGDGKPLVSATMACRWRPRRSTACLPRSTRGCASWARRTSARRKWRKRSQSRRRCNRRLSLRRAPRKALRLRSPRTRSSRRR
jgi:transketolase